MGNSLALGYRYSKDCFRTVHLLFVKLEDTAMCVSALENILRIHKISSLFQFQ